MADKFDPYHKWLGIPPRDQPPNYYRLLSIELFESDPEVIDGAARRLAVYVKSCAVGPHLEDAKKLFVEIVAARRCLLDPKLRAVYDQQLKSPAPAAPAASGAQAAPAPPRAAARTAGRKPDAKPLAEARPPEPPPAPPPPPPEPLQVPLPIDTLPNDPAGISTLSDFVTSARSRATSSRSRKSGAHRKVKKEQSAATDKKSRRGKSKAFPKWIVIVAALGVVVIVGVVAAVLFIRRGDIVATKEEPKAADSKAIDEAPQEPPAERAADESSEAADATAAKADDAAHTKEEFETDEDQPAQGGSKPAGRGPRAAGSAGGPTAALWLAIETGTNAAAVQKAVEAGVDVDAKDKQGRTPLRLAVINKRADLVKALLAAKANPNVPDARGETPLMSAVQAGSEAIIKLLLEAGADPDRQSGVDPTGSKAAETGQ